jgi:sterol 14-demethylase
MRDVTGSLARGRISAQASDAPPHLPGGVPFLGHAYEFWSRPVDLLARGQARFGDVWSLDLAGQRATVLSGPQANEAFFLAPADVLSARECYQFTVPVFGPGVAYDVPPAEMDRQLSFVHPALGEKRLRSYVDVMVDETERYLDTWGDRGERDLFTTTQDLTLFIATRCLLGNEIRRHFSEEFARLYHDLDGGMTVLAFFVPHAPLPAFRRRDRARAAVNDLLARIMAARREQGVTPHEDFLGTLMAYRDEGGVPLSDHVIAGLLLTLIFAGQHTSAVLAAWTGILLHQHPAFIPPVMEEQRREIGGGETTYESLRKLAVLERCIKEAERLRPPLIVLMRTVLRPYRIQGFDLPVGSLALTSPAISHRLPRVYADPDTYDPSRFADGREEDRKAPYSLIGFGGGKHRCIGMVFAYQQIKVIWTAILRRYEIELVEQEYLPDYRTLVVGPRQPCRIRYRRRHA